MFRLSCFHSPLNSHKSKKTVQLCTESMQKTLEDYPAKRPEKDSGLSKVSERVGSADNTNPSSSSVVQDWKSEGFETVNDVDGARNVRRMTKSVSLGSLLVRYDGDESSSPRNDTDPGRPKDPKDPVSDSIEPSSNAVNHESANQDSVFSLESTKRSENDVCESSENRFSEDGTLDSRTAFVKSTSMPVLRSRGNPVHRSRSFEDLESLVSRRKDSSADENEVDSDKISDENEVDFDKTNEENPADDGFDAYGYMGSAKDWIVPAVDELGDGKEVEEDRSVLRWEDLPSKEFKIKRIEKWVMDLRHCSSLEETDGVADFDGQGQNGKIDVAAASRTTDSKAVLGMEGAKRYISSLSSSAAAAQLSNHGLVAIPLMSAFVSLKALNLSGNAIVRITAGALPRGLHVLNLSKNSIATIEGLRELTRLRVLDLSYNRILRIGHGLASCSSLKELYLAGNKIGEVEGLHRLLKLTVLDLRFNKVATTKGLGQLAANYNSLQAVSLEGNPAQKNMGDEPLKKYLVGLLPHLAYFNRHPIKDSADRAGRLPVSAHQADHRGGGSRAELKNAGKGRAAVHGRLPPSGAVHGRDLSSKLRSFRPDLAAMRRTHSEGLLRAV